MKVTATLVVLVVLGVFSQALAKNYYLQTAKQLNWWAAFEACAAQNMQLATVNTKAEQIDLQNTMIAAGHANTWMWISGSDQAQEGSFVWMSTGQSFTYTQWSINQPDNAGGIENCVHVWPRPAGEINWNDRPCSMPLNFICEDKIGKKCSGNIIINNNCCNE